MENPIIASATGSTFAAPPASFPEDMLRTVLALCVPALVMGAVPRGCVASAPLGSFELAVKPPGTASPRALRQTNAVPKGYQLAYTPRGPGGKKARVALVLAPAEKGAKLTVFEPQPAGQPARWTAPFRVGVVGVVFGPQGLDRKKVESLIGKDQELISQLADYAEQTAQVEGLIETLTAAESGSGSVEGALRGFAAQSGAAIPKLDRTAPTDRQAMSLLRALNPALGAYDPLAPQARMQQSAGLAASVAALFLGSNVALAAGGAAMVQNLRSLLFPGTDFRSALAQPAENEGLTLCAKRQAAKSRTRLAYLWAYRVSNSSIPAVAVAAAHLPLGVKSAIAVQPQAASDFAALSRARDWALVSADGRAFPVPVKPAEGQRLEIDLPGAAVAPGAYRLTAKWDWDPFSLAGDLHLYALPDLKTVSLERASSDRVVDGAGPVAVKLAGADFQFLEKLTLDKQPLYFKLPLGPRAGPQRSLETAIDTSRFRPGHHVLALYLPDGKAFELPIRVLPPNPKIDNLPLRANLGETRQALLLRGSGLERIQKISSPGADIELGEAARDGRNREAAVRLGPDARKGERLPVSLQVEGIEAPLEVPAAIEVAGPRPRIAAIERSLADDLGVALRDGELPAGSFTSFAIRVENAEGQPALLLACGEDEKAMRPGQRTAAARLDAAGAGTLFLSVDPAGLGRAGCDLAVRVETAAGRSDSTTLGRVLRLPHIDRFTLTDEKAGPSSYAGLLVGRDLETIERAGWDARSGLPVASLPRPVAGEGDRQSLRVVLPWPAPAPHAPVYIWLRGETEGRATRAQY
jgi:hypothetical protein